MVISLKFLKKMIEPAKLWPEAIKATNLNRGYLIMYALRHTTGTANACGGG
jgi:hypothetical protein